MQFLPESQNYDMLIMVLAIQSFGYVIPKVSRLMDTMVPTNPLTANPPRYQHTPLRHIRPYYIRARENPERFPLRRPAIFPSLFLAEGGLCLEGVVG